MVRTVLLLFCAVLALTCIRPALAAPVLECHLTYAGATQHLVITPVNDPYSVASVDVGGRFRFKAVMVAQGDQIDYIKTYAYIETPRQPVLVQQGSYFPPFDGSGPRQRLTGKQFVYAGPLERELQFECVLRGVRP